MKLEELPEWKPQYEYVNRVGRVGCHGKVYLIGDRHVAKIKHVPYLFLLNDQEAVDCLVKEFNITRHLYEEGISVPKPEGIYSMKLRSVDNPISWFIPRTFPAFVMEAIYGVSLGSLKGEEREEALDLTRKELTKARRWYTTYDSDDESIWHNTLWVPEQKRVVLIDFEFWKR